MYDGRNGGSKAVNKKTPVATHPPSAAPTHLGLIVYLVWLMLIVPWRPDSVLQTGREGGLQAGVVQRCRL